MTVPYYCARDNMSIGISDCMKNFKNIDIPTLVNQTKRYAENGLVDPTRYMINHKVYIFDGLNDSTVMPGQVTYMMLTDYAAELLQCFCESVCLSDNCISISLPAVSDTYSTCKFKMADGNRK